MKPAFSPLLLTALVTFHLLLGKPRAAAAAHRSDASSQEQEDALADGEIDPEDIAARGPTSTLEKAVYQRPFLRRSSGSAWLSLVGFSRRTLDDRHEHGGFVVLGLPLERSARSSHRRTTAAPLTKNVAFEVVPNASFEQAPTSEYSYGIALTPRLARSCVVAAWRAAGLGSDDVRLEEIVSRARWSAALPEARLRAVRFDDARLSLDTSTDTSRLRDSSGANVGFEARLTWRFDRLVYSDDEPAFERIRLEHRNARTRIGAKVLDALFHWQRAMLDLQELSPAQRGTRDEADVRLRLLEAESVLDVLTNGWFGSHAARSRLEPTARSHRQVERGEAKNL